MIVSLVTCLIELINKFFKLIVIFVILKVIYNYFFHENDATQCHHHLLSNVLDENLVKKMHGSKRKHKKNCWKKENFEKSFINAIQSGDLTKNEAFFSEENFYANPKVYFKDSLSILNPPNEVENIPLKNFKGINLEKSSHLVFSTKLVSKKQGDDHRMKQNESQSDKVSLFKDFLSTNLMGSCSNSQSLPKKQNKSQSDKVLPSKDFLCTNLMGSCSNSQSLPKQQNKSQSDKVLPSKDFLSTNLMGSCSNYQSLPKQQNKSQPDKVLPSKDFFNINLAESWSSSQLLSKQKEELLNSSLPSNGIENPKSKKYSFNFRIVFKQQNKRMKSRVALKFKENTGAVLPFELDRLGEKFHSADVAFTSKEMKDCLPAHSTVLAEKSKFFKDLLFGDLANKSGLKMDLEINVSFCIFFSMIKWFYSGKIAFSDDFTVMEIYQAAKQFQVPKLIEECRSYIQSMKITEHSVLSNLQLSNIMKIAELNKRCIKYIKQNTLEVINSVEFLNSQFNTVKKICELRRLSLTSEVEMLDGLVMWLNAQPNLKKSAVKSLERAVLRCVRFLNFSAEEFADVMLKHAALFTPDESLNIFLYLVDPTPEDFKALPSWCNKSYRTLSSNPKSTGKRLLSLDSREEKIEIQLKTSEEVQDVSELTSILEMRCMNGIHKVKSVKFSFRAVEKKGCKLAYLEIKVRVLPNGKVKWIHSEKNLLLEKNEITFNFSEGITVYEGQVLRMEVTANMTHSNFLQFDEWFPKSDFDCFFLSKPIAGRLYFISEVVYGPVVP